MTSLATDKTRADAIVAICQSIIAVTRARSKISGMPSPEGPIYAHLMGVITLEQFDALVDFCVKSGHIKHAGNHCLLPDSRVTPTTVLLEPVGITR